MWVLELMPHALDHSYWTGFLLIRHLYVLPWTCPILRTMEYDGWNGFPVRSLLEHVACHCYDGDVLLERVSGIEGHRTPLRETTQEDFLSQ